MSDSNPDVGGIDQETVTRIQERVLQKEKEQLHLKKVHGIIPDIKEIIEEEVQDTDEN